MGNHLNSSTGNEEPLVDAGVNGSRSLVVTLGDVEGLGIGAVVGVRNGGVGTVHLISSCSSIPLVDAKLTG
jgi:hypothetical protein